MNFQNPLSYNQHAVMQKDIALHLIESARQEIIASNTICDIGCESGFVGKKISEINPTAQITGIDVSQKMIDFASKFYHETICADIEIYTLLKESFDVSFSSMCLQWIKNQELVIKKIKSFTKQSFYFAIPLPESLNEIKECFNKANLACPIIDFKVPLNLKPFYIKSYQQTFESLLKTMKSFNKIGAYNNAFKEELTASNFKALEEFFQGNVSWKIGFFKT